MRRIEVYQHRLARIRKALRAVVEDLSRSRRHTVPLMDQVWRSIVEVSDAERLASQIAGTVVADQRE